MSDLTVPDEFHDWPWDARAFVLAEANSKAELRRCIDGHAGLDSSEWNEDNPGVFTKDELAVLLMALGGPEGVDDGTKT